VQQVPHPIDCFIASKSTCAMLSLSGTALRHNLPSLQVNRQLQKSRAELLAKGKERNQKLMTLSKLQQTARDLAMCEKVSWCILHLRYLVCNYRQNQVSKKLLNNSVL